MKVAMIGHKRIPSREGGVEVVVEQLSTMLVQKGHIVDVYNRKGKNVQDENVDINYEKIKEYKGLNIITIPTINKKGIDALLYSFFATVRAIFGKYDVIHYHAEGPAVMLWLPHILGIKTVVTIHGLDWKSAKWGTFATKYLKLGEKVAAKYADEVIVLSKGIQKYFKEKYNRDTNFIPNGIIKPKVKEVDIINKKWGLEKNNYILFLGRIVPGKGLEYLIEAFKRINTDKKLVIAGGSSHTNNYLKQIREITKDDNRIIMTGFVQGQELEELYSNCYIYCLPSEAEGMSMSLLEAMSYGCRCLVSNIEENTQVIGIYGKTFESRNVNDLQKKIEELINDKQEKLDSKIISEYVLNKFSLENTIKNTEKVLKSKKNKSLEEI